MTRPQNELDTDPTTSPMDRGSSQTPPVLGPTRSPRRLETRWLVALMTALVLLPRLPFLGPGYGHDPDAWAIAHGAWKIWTTGHYTFSRPPGFPLQELVCGLLWPAGPWALNGATALMSLVAALCFSSILRRVSTGDHLLSGLALAYVPGVFVNSVVSLDYLWSMGFLLAAVYAVLRERFLLAGALLGCAIGCRITTGGMLVPLAVLTVLTQPSGARLRSLARVCATTILVASLLFALVLGHERWHWDVLEFLRYHETLRRAKAPFPVVQRLQSAPYDLFGTVGCVALGVVASMALVRRLRRNAWPPVVTEQRRAMVATCLVAIVVAFATFLRFPFVTYYLLPLVPFLLLLAACFIGRRAWALVCVLLVASSWVDVGGHGFSSGPMLEAQDKRESEYANGVQILEAIQGLPSESVVVTGFWTYQLRTMVHGMRVGPVQIVPRIASEEAYARFARNRTIYYVPRANDMEKRLHHIDLEALGATPLFDPE